MIERALNYNIRDGLEGEKQLIPSGTIDRKPPESAPLSATEKTAAVSIEDVASV